MTRRGFTLVELLVTLAVLGILGGALTRLTINQSRYVSQQEAIMETRQIARQALGLLSNELRMVSDSGVVAVAADSIVIRVPYAYGMLCGISSGSRIASVLPYDSIAWAQAQSPRVAYRSGSRWHPTTATVTVATSTATTCDADSIKVLSGGRLVSLSPSSATSTANSGDLFYLYETVTYKFATSTSLSGRRALFRRSGSTTEELLVPFSSSARFAFLTGSRLTLTTTAPSSLNNLSGLELRLISQSTAIAGGKTTYTEYDFRPRVRFGNKALY